MPSFPLCACSGSDQKDCVARLFPDGVTIAARNPDDFPRRYLELYDANVRADHCAEHKDRLDCEARLAAVSSHFNPDGKRPDAFVIGVALEGGGSKSAPFALGTLAGLHELGVLERHVGAISSVSGGSYAASYYFNRLYDRNRDTSGDGTDLSVDEASAGSPADWFRSCIPQYFVDGPQFGALRESAANYSCWERDVTPQDAENYGVARSKYNQFDARYEFLGHVWKNHDLLRADTQGNLSTQDEIRLRELGNVGLLAGETFLTIPFQFLARTVFRWPLNSAPSKLAYKLGLERQYGYTPHDWQAVGRSDLAHLIETILVRRKTRTLTNFRPLAASGAPTWILNAAAPGHVGGMQWVFASARDPVRQLFELTWDGYGSGVYGYARQPPDAPYDIFGPYPQGMPVVDAVVASAAFFDSDQALVTRQPARLIADAAQHFLNIEWFTEVRNFNVDQGTRRLSNAMPWPFYLHALGKGPESPYIHLQDGGNAENTGILSLLRRGYRTIVYAHGTQDTQAKWESICHLKNQLELDGAYFIRSPRLEEIMKVRQQAAIAAKPAAPAFSSYLDALCSNQFDESDLNVFDDNAVRSTEARIPAVAKLYCGRLGITTNGDRTRPDPGYHVCDPFNERYRKDAGARDTTRLPALADGSDLFYQWQANEAITFEVFQGDTLRYLAEERPSAMRLSTIIAVVPGIAWNDVARQLLPGRDRVSADDWQSWCATEEAERLRQQIAYCAGPDNAMVGDVGQSGPEHGGLPCTALAHIIRDGCRVKTPWEEARPQFPQDNFIVQTLHTTYTTYAAYFDLARHQVRSVLCRHWPMEAGPLPAACNPCNSNDLTLDRNCQSAQRISRSEQAQPRALE